ncbi:MAG: TonB family protein [Deltaproteobacteria bacterium]|nr:TonB family protein [Deltaproteobacteria bacterium]
MKRRQRVSGGWTPGYPTVLDVLHDRREFLRALGGAALFITLPGGCRPLGSPALAQRPQEADAMSREVGPALVPGEEVRTPGVVKTHIRIDEPAPVSGAGSEPGGTGVIAPSLVKNTFRKRAAALQKCYTDLLRRNPEATGRVVVEVAISPAGVAEATVVENTIDDAALGRCLVEKINAWRFPAPSGGGGAVFRVPVDFSLPR